MSSYALEPAVTGHRIKELIANPEARRKAYVEGLFYERSTLMIASDPGLGKSSLTVQALLEISAGLPVFGGLVCPEPKKCYYIQKERAIDEVVERIELMQQHIDWNPDNLIIDKELQAFSLTNPQNFRFIIDRIKAHKPDIICIDPIGAGSPGLSSDEGANNFCSFLTILQKEVGATHWLNHHTVKPSYTREGDKVEKDDPFYGSQWLKAHVTGSFHVSRSGQGTTWKCKKDSHSNLVEKLELSFDNETFISSLLIDQLSVPDKIKTFCRACKASNKRFKFVELEAATTCARRTLRAHLAEPPFLHGLKRHKSSGRQTLYEVVEDF